VQGVKFTKLQADVICEVLNHPVEPVQPDMDNKELEGTDLRWVNVEETKPDTMKNKIAALPDMILPLVWYNADTEIQSQGVDHFYRVYANSTGGYTFDDSESYSTHESQDEAIAAGNTRYRRQIMAAFGVAL